MASAIRCIRDRARLCQHVGSGDWKHFIIIQGDRRPSDGRTLDAYSCTEAELSSTSRVGSIFPHLYRCGGYYGLQTYLGTSQGSTIYTRRISAGDCWLFPRTGNTAGCLPTTPTNG